MFRVGDYVMVRQDAHIEKDLVTGCYYVEPMDAYKGSVLVIEEVRDATSERDRRYWLKSEDGKSVGWSWIDKWLELAIGVDPEDDIMVPSGDLSDIL